MFKNKTKVFAGILALIIVLLLHNELCITQSVHAAPGDFLDNMGGRDGVKKIASTLSGVNTFIFAALLILLNMTQFLMQNTFFSNGIMMQALNSIWVLSRDIVNIAFALMLIGVAIYTIITADTKFVKEKLVNFVLAVILVNFSWFFPRVIIDVSNVLTATVFSIPQMLPGPSCHTINERGVAEECKVMVDSYILGSEDEMKTWCNTNPPIQGNGPNGVHTDCFRYPGFYAWKSQRMSDALNNGWAPSTAILNGLVISFIKVTNLPKVPASVGNIQAPTGTSADYYAAMNILFTIMMSFVFILATLLPILGLAVGFLVRIVVLWVCIAFMPFTFIGYAVKGTLTTQLFGFETDIWKNFVTAAFLPATVGIPLVIGFIMMSTAARIPMPSSFPLTFGGMPLISGVPNWWAMLWMIAAVGILWKGSFDALKRNDIVGKFTEPMRNLGNTVFKGAMQLPLLTPLPIPGMPAGTNLGTLVHGPEIAAGVIRGATSGRAMNRSVFQQMNEAFGGNQAQQIASAMNNEQVKKIVDAIGRINAGGLDRRGLDAQLHIIKTSMGDRASGLDLKEVMGKLKEVARFDGAKDDTSGKRLTDIQDKITEALDKDKNTH